MTQVPSNTHWKKISTVDNEVLCLRGRGVLFVVCVSRASCPLVLFEASPVALARQLCTPWDSAALVGTMATRHHSTSRSPPSTARREACRLPSDSRQLPRLSVQAPADPALQSPFAPLDAPTYRGDPPMPAPVPVSGPSPTIHLANVDPFARARIAAVQSRVAAPAVSDPRPPPPVPAFSPFRDGHYWCSKCPRKGFTTIPGFMRHITHQHAGSTVDESTSSLFIAIERVTCTTPACGGLRRMCARVCNRCGQASQARPYQVGDIIMGPLGAPASDEDTIMVDADAAVTPSLTVDLPHRRLAERLHTAHSCAPLEYRVACSRQMSTTHDQCRGTVLEWDGPGARRLRSAGGGSL